MPKSTKTNKQAEIEPSRTISQNLQCYKMPFFAALAVGLIVHFAVYSNGLQNPDALLTGEEYFSGDMELGSGRWGLAIWNHLHGGLSSPVLMSVVTLIFFSLAGISLVKILGVKNSFASILIPLTIICTPYVSLCITYYYCSAAYGFAFLLAVLSVGCLLHFSLLEGTLFGIICLAFSLGIYQSGIGIATALCLMVLILRFFKMPQAHKRNRELAVQMLVMISAGTCLYYGILRVIQHIRNVNMSSYKGANKIGVGYILQNSPSTVRHTYSDFLQYFFGREIAANYYGTRLFYCAVLLLALFAFIYAVWQNRKNRLPVLLACLCLLLIPLAANLIDIAAPDTRIGLLTIGGMVLVVPFCISLSEFAADEWNERKIKEGYQRSYRILCFLMSCCLVWSYSLQVNANAMAMETERDKMLYFANRIYTQVENSTDYDKNTPVLIAGLPDMGNYPNDITIFSKTDGYVKWGMIWRNYDGDLFGWPQLYRQYLGIKVNSCTREQFNHIAATEEFKKMPSYPERGAIKKIDDVLVVKVSNIDEWN